MGVLLRAEHIDKRFGITHAVNDVSLDINAGEVRALIGENGSGKSTFCQMLCDIYTIGGCTFTSVAENIFLGHEEPFMHYGLKAGRAANVWR